MGFEVGLGVGDGVGHGSVWHLRFCSVAAHPPIPPWLTVKLLFLRTRRWVPPAQDAEHTPHLPNGDVLQITVGACVGCTVGKPVGLGEGLWVGDGVGFGVGGTTLIAPGGSTHGVGAGVGQGVGVRVGLGVGYDVGNSVSVQGVGAGVGVAVTFVNSAGAFSDWRLCHAGSRAISALLGT